MDAQYPARLLKSDINPHHDPASDIGSDLGEEVVVELDDRLYQFPGVKLKETESAMSYHLHAGRSSPARTDDGEFLHK